MDVRAVQNWTMKSLTESLGDLVTSVRGSTGTVLGGGIVTDSREIPQNSVFVALKGTRFDGHDYALKAAEAGARVLVLERSVGAPCEIIVRNSSEAYGRLAAAWRAQFNVPVICVVGANGKTTTTQMIAAILRAAIGEERVLATQKNFNNEVGVPKTLLGFHSEIAAAVIEAGINHPGEMAYLSSWIRPTVVVVTNAQREHQEFLNGVEASARENGLAIVSLSAKGTAVLPAGDGCFSVWQSLARARGCRTVTYALDGTADLTAQRQGSEVCFKGSVQGQTCEQNCTLSVAGDHMTHDAAAAAAASLAAGVLPKFVVQGLKAFRAVAGRGVRHQLPSGAVLIDEAYNANPDSMRAAIDVLASCPSPRILVAGDMGEVGENARAFHEEIGMYAKQKGIEKMLCLGENMSHAAEVFGAGAEALSDKGELETRAADFLLRPCTMLVKASNFMGFRQVVGDLLGGVSRESVG